MKMFSFHFLEHIFTSSRTRIFVLFYLSLRRLEGWGLRPVLPQCRHAKLGAFASEGPPRSMSNLGSAPGEL
jgi:hypothetical protein